MHGEKDRRHRMLSKNQFSIILKTQAKFANVPVSFFKPYFSGKGMPKKWYLKHSWTEEQEKKFEEWLVKYLMKEENLSRKYAQKKAEWYLFDYGWTYPKVTK